MRLLPPGLLALHGNRAESLVDAVLAWIDRHPLGALEPEIVLVQSNGVAEWFKMALAERAGVCAAAQVELPARFLWRSYRQVLGPAAVPPRSAVDKSALTWRLLQQLPGLVAQPGFEPVAGFLRGDEPDRLWQLAGRLADLYDQYQVYRSDWLGDWVQGHDQLARGQHAALPVPPDQLWQPLLWRAVLGGLNEAERAAIRPQIHQRALAVLRAGEPLAAPLPRRVVLFGMSHLPLPVLELLADMSRYSQVLIAIPNPCRFHWADAIDGRELLAAARRRHPLRGGVDLAQLPIESLHAHAHPLLAAWGRQGRDFVRQLDAFDETATAQARLGIPRVDFFDEADDAPDAPLLVQVQQRIRDLVPLAEHPQVVLAADDRSIVFHSAHSALREVEVLHDQLLDLLAHPPGDKPLAPRDIVVMVPDIERFAPAVRAVFGQVPPGDARHIPWGISDLSARASHPLVGALDWLLHAPQQRFAMSELRDLLDVPAIAARFGLAPDDVAQLTHWMAGAGIRWGLDAVQRGALGLQACGAQNTAEFGLERMLLGYAAGSGSFEGIEAWDEVGGLAAELAGALAALIARLRQWLESCQASAE
ncbi:MAG: exodeoxyribonuclease V subunit gamma, partial [Giesbergeria sp.]